MMRKTYLLVIAAIVFLTALAVSGVMMTGFVAPTNEIEVMAAQSPSEPEFGTGGAPIEPEDWLLPESESSLPDVSAPSSGEKTSESSVFESSENSAESLAESSVSTVSSEPSVSSAETQESQLPDSPPPVKESIATGAPPSSEVASSVLPGPPPAVSLPEKSDEPPAVSLPPLESSFAGVEESSAEGSVPPPSGETLRVSLNGTATEGNAYDLLCQIVEAEMGGSFHAEALKAQAVAAYSYIRYENAAGRTPSLPGRTPTRKTQDAVSAVLGETLTYGGRTAFTPYHASSAGYTNPSSEVWGGSFPYLVRVSSKYDPSPAYRDQRVVMPAASLQDKLERYLGVSLSDEPADWNLSLSANESGYVSRITLTAADGSSCSLTGRQMRENVLAYGIRSHAFTVEVDEDRVIFTTNGYGHGVGMSQTGANAYASNDGWTYDQILSHYYPGTSLS